MKLGLGFAVAIPAVIAVVLAAVLWFIVAMVRLSAFLEAAVAVYRVGESGLLTRDKTDIPPFYHTDFHRLEIVEACDDRWVVRYESPSGKPKKTTIPNAYPGLARFMETVGTAAEPWRG